MLCLTRRRLCLLLQRPYAKEGQTVLIGGSHSIAGCNGVLFATFGRTGSGAGAASGASVSSGHLVAANGGAAGGAGRRSLAGSG